MAEPLKATFFTLQQRDRAMLLPATLILVVLVALIVGAWLALNWGALSQFFALAYRQEAPPADDAQTMHLMGGMMMVVFSAFIFMFPLYMVIAAYEAACLRWMIRGEIPGFAGFAFDHDMWRVYGVYWCWLILQFLVSTIAGMLMFPLMLMLMLMTMGEIMSDPTPDPVAMMRWQLSVQLPISLLQYLPLIFLGIRFGPAAATSVARRRFSFFEAWAVTRDRFWTLLGSFALLWLLIGIVFALEFAGVFGFIFGDIGWGLFAAWPDIDVAQAEAIHARMFSAQGLTLFIGSYVANFALLLIYALMSYGVNAKAALAALDEGKIKAEPAT